MGLFSWFSWQLERRTLKQQIDRLLADINEAAQEAAELRRELGATERLLHEAQRGDELVVQTSETELEQKAWQLWLQGDDSIEGVWRKAELWLRARQSKRNGQEKLTDEQ